MGEGEAEVAPRLVPDATGAAPRRRRSLWSRGVACLAMIPLIGYIGTEGQSLWAEWDSLRRDQARERASAVVGYMDINPEVSYARSPSNWTHDEGEESFLWACWKDGEHHWFRFARGDVDVRQLTLPIGRDVIRAIDYPVYEHDGGQTWARVPRDAPVIGFERDGSAVAYPMKVLQKVLIVNDRLGDRPVLVICSSDGDVSVYDANVEGRRVTLGHGGYFRGNRPVLYDRATQSLWAEGDEGMVALAGRLKGVSLKRLDSPKVVEWEGWRAGHPAGRLLVGADRSKGMPVD